MNQENFVECSFCGETHEHDLKAALRINNMYNIKSENIIYIKEYEKKLYSAKETKFAVPVTATIRDQFTKFHYPFCYTPHYFNEEPRDIFKAHCNKGFIEIIDTIEETYVSNKRKNLKRLDSI